MENLFQELKFIKEQLDIQKQLEDSKLELFELDLVAESQVLAEKNKRLSLEKEFTKKINLQLWVKANKNWTNDINKLKKFGFGVDF